jgi:hypothetical protein
MSAQVYSSDRSADVNEPAIIYHFYHTLVSPLAQLQYDEDTLQLGEFDAKMHYHLEPNLAEIMNFEKTKMIKCVAIR